MNNLYNAQLINDKNTLDTLCFLLKIDKTIPFKKVPFSLLTKENKVYGIVIGDKVVEL